jgi:hypothetical protein
MITIAGVCVAAVLGALGWRLSGHLSEVREPRPVRVLPAPRIGVR